MRINSHWGDALRYCNGSLAKKPPVLPAGKTWRLPNINELKSIVDRSQLNPAMDTSVLIAGGDYYWTSTTTNTNFANAWTVNFFVRQCIRDLYQGLGLLCKMCCGTVI
ncbi:PF07603 family protein [Leptospira interrogans serovar Canicola]|nr:PF07603 family protein [Leptospira interrogans serovar Canicola]